MGLNYTCNICCDKYSHKPDYYLHLRKHFTPEIMFIMDDEFINTVCCKVCKILFKTKQSLKYHLGNHSIEELLPLYNIDEIEHLQEYKKARIEYNNIYHKNKLNDEDYCKSKIERQRRYRMNNRDKILEKYHTIYKFKRNYRKKSSNSSVFGSFCNTSSTIVPS